MKIAKTIYLTRHGKTDYNDKDLIQGWMDNPLSESGKNEAACLAKRMKETKIDIIYHSPLCRTKETAEIINQYHQAPMQVIENFIEMNLGDWEGQNFLDVVRSHPDIYQQWATNVDAEIPGGETFRQLYERAKPGVQKVMASPHQNILIVAHAMVNRGIIGNFMDMEPLLARRFRMDNCSFSRLLVYQLKDGYVQLMDCWNDISHLT